MRKYEKMVADTLTACDWRWEFEKHVYRIKTKMPGQVCVHCGEPQFKITKYTPDFLATNHMGYEMVVEVKGGSFKATDQARYKRFVQQHPDVNYVMAFRANVRLRNLKGRPTVKEWGDKHGITVLVGIDEFRGILTGEV